MELEITPAVVRAIADLAGITVPPEDMAPLVAVMANQVGMVAKLLPLDYADVAPIVSMDPRWP
jgi:hypothetical protein